MENSLHCSTSISQGFTKQHNLFQRVIEFDDSEAFNKLFKKFYTPLCYFSMRTVGTREIAEEVVADVFVKFWNGRHKIQINTSFESYIYRSVRNQSIDYLRSSLNEKVTKESIDTLDFDTHGIEYNNSDPVADAMNFVEKAICKLPKQCQLVFRMNKIDGMPYKQIALELKLSTKTVEAHISNALKQLRAELRPKHQLIFG